MKKFFQDFKAFINKGNIIDMAVGVVVGGAFSKIVSSLVADIITPLISVLTGKVTLSELKWIIYEAQLDAAGKIIKPETALKYGNFLQMVLDFLIIAFSVFVVIRIMMKTQERLNALTKKETAPEEPTAPTTKICPFCKSEIAIDATRCAHCTSQLED